MKKFKGDGFIRQIENAKFEDLPKDGKISFAALSDYIKSDRDSQNESIEFTKGWCGQESHDKWITELMDHGFTRKGAEHYFTPNPKIFGGSGFDFDFTKD